MKIRGLPISCPYVLTIALLILASQWGATATAHAQSSQILDGSWISDVTNAATGARNITLYTFTADGGVISSNRDHPIRGPAHGAWVSTGDREFLVTFVRLRFETDGSFIGTQRLRSYLTLNETMDEYVVSAQNDFYDVEGNFESSNRTTSTGRRIVVERPDF